MMELHKFTGTSGCGWGDSVPEKIEMATHSLTDALLHRKALITETSAKKLHQGLLASFPGSASSSDDLGMRFSPTYLPLSQKSRPDC